MSQSDSMLVLPTFDGQNRGLVVVRAGAIDMFKPAATYGMTNVYLQDSGNVLSIEMELPELMEKMKSIGIQFTDLAGGRTFGRSAQSNDH